jgi:replication factor C subunit 3/5
VLLWLMPYARADVALCRAALGACRLVLLCNNISRVLDAVRSRTLPVRVPAPTHAELCDLLQQVAHKESIVLPAEFAARVGARSC